jgi:tetratricopeptide (TPR) repeat protein
VAPQALHYLENQLSEQFGRVSEQLRSLDDTQRTTLNLNNPLDNLHRQADDWAQRYHELSERLAESENENEQAKQAHDLIQRGDFAKAEVLLPAIAANEESDVTRAATQYDLGELAMLRFDARSALSHYEKAFRYKPHNPRYAASYARAAYTEQNADVVTTLTSLGDLYRGTGRLADADKAFSEALTIYRDLAAHDPAAYRPNVATTLNSLGDLYRGSGRLADADRAFSEALTIYRDLAAHNPAAYRPNVATTLNNLGILYRGTGRLADTEKAFSEALTIYRDLAAHDPAYKPYLAQMLDSLGTLSRDAGRLADTDKALSEALIIRRDLDAHASGAYRLCVASTLTSLGDLYRDIGHRADADRALSEALTIYRSLPPSNPAYVIRIVSLTTALAELRGESSSSPHLNPDPPVASSFVGQ